MFFTPSSRNAVKSSAIKDIEVNQKTNQAVVTYNNGRQYLYSGICEDAMFDVIFGQVKSFGKWVNSALLQDADVSTFKLAWFITHQFTQLSIHLWTILSLSKLSAVLLMLSRVSLLTCLVGWFLLSTATVKTIPIPMYHAVQSSIFWCNPTSV